MTSPLNPDASAPALTSDLAEAADALRSFVDGPGRAAADALAQSFAEAGARIVATLAQSAARGEVSLRSLARAAAAEAARLAVETWAPPRGRSEVANDGGGSSSSVIVNLHLAAGAGGSEVESWRRSEGQIAAAIARAVALGRRSI